MFEKSKFDSIIHARHSLRMKGYDYSIEGAYFVTIATYQRVCLFGNVHNGKIVLNTYGNIAYEQWIRLPQRFLSSNFPLFVIMPNHVHGIIHIVRGAGEEFEPVSFGIPPQRPYDYPHIASGSLGVIVRAYKASVTYRINALRGFTNPPIWQRNYHDHIIRNEKEYQSIWDYIETNPETWMGDRLNPK
jgi:REP element-mobilizing transposase RayT